MTLPVVVTQRKRIGEMLVEANLINQQQLQDGLIYSSNNNRKIGEILIEQGLITPQQLAIFISLQLNIPYINLKKQEVQGRVVDLISESVARKYNVMPIDVVNGALVVAMADPENTEIIDNLSAITKKRIEPMIGVPADIKETIDQHYRAGTEIEKQMALIPARAVGELLEEDLSTDAVSQAPVVRAIDLLLSQAVRDRASDIHIEPQEDILRVRFRIDGILQETLSLPMSVHSSMISRLKIMAGMNIAERRRPQDGQITFTMDNKQVDIRAASSNTVNGEMMVLRVLDKSFAFRTLPELGFQPDVLEKYQDMLKTPFGMVITSGPTGSGKTTTLYASVNQLDSVGRNIITIEDPVEYHFDNINQMQVNTQAGVTFAAGLRACMRLDPDVILVGEIRDNETAQIGIQAALTGHLVLSSVHANDTVGVIFRLQDLGVESFLTAQAIIGVVAQRMVRRVCPHCARKTQVTPEEQLAYEQEMQEEKSEFLSGVGCNVCANTGYLGRAGIYEVMIISETVRRMILSNAGSDEIRNQAYEEGMTSLWHAGMLLVKKGITTPYEVLRNVYSIG